MRVALVVDNKVVFEGTFPDGSAPVVTVPPVVTIPPPVEQPPPAPAGGGVLAEGARAWFPAGSAVYAIYIEPDQVPCQIELELANLSEVANLALRAPSGAYVGKRDGITGGGSLRAEPGAGHPFPVLAVPGSYTVEVSSPQIGIVKYRTHPV